MFRDSFGFHNDPFFQVPSDINSSFGNLEKMFAVPSFAALEAGENNSNNRSIRKRSDGVFEDMNSQFGRMNKMIENAMKSMSSSNNIEFNDPNGAFYSSSSVYSYSNDGNGEPQVYQAHRSVKQGPGGVREEQKAVRDSRRQEEKMAIGRYLGERGKQTERRRNLRTGQQEENNELYGLDESEVGQFSNEWDQLARKAFGRGRGGIEDRRGERQRYVTADGVEDDSNSFSHSGASPHRRRGSHKNHQLALTNGRSDHKNRKR